MWDLSRYYILRGKSDLEFFLYIPTSDACLFRIENKEARVKNRDEIRLKAGKNFIIDDPLSLFLALNSLL